MNIQYLEEFNVLAGTLNYTKAAESLFMTQPALSKHIASLEKELGVKLIQRTTRSVELTSCGKMLKNSLPAFLSQYYSIVKSLHDLDSPHGPSLTIGLPAVTVNDYLGEVPAIFGEKYPTTELRCISGWPEENIKRLVQDEVDIAMLTHIPFPDASLMTFVDYKYEPMIIICSPNCSLAKKDKVRIEDLKGYKFIGVDSSYYRLVWEKIRQRCEWQGFEPEIMYCKELDHAILHARLGQGVVTVSIQHKSLVTHGLTYVILDEPSCCLQLSLVYKSTNKNPAIKNFVSIFMTNGYFLEKHDA